MKKKRMTKAEFKKIAERQWVPVQLVGNGMPNWMKGIPDDKLEMVLVSGTFINPINLELNGTTYKNVVGGMDIYRNDANDLKKGYPINKDHYFILLDPENNDALLVHGPVKDNEHWLEKLPNLPDDVTIINSTEE